LHRGLFNNEEHRSAFKIWYKEDKVIRFNNVNYSREDIVQYITNKSGGAHLDPKLNQEDLYNLEKEKISQLINIVPLTSGLNETLVVIARELISALLHCGTLPMT